MLTGFKFTVRSKTGKEKITEKVEAHKIAFITNELNLTPEESQKFWPIYNEYSAKERDLRPEFKGRPESVTEAEANDIINKFFENEEKRLESDEELLSEIQNGIACHQSCKTPFCRKKIQRKTARKNERKKR